MIVKDEFLEWLRVELAIGAEFKRHLCHPIGLTSGVDSKSVRLTLRDAHHSVQKRRGEKKQCAENQYQQREPGWIGNSAYTPICHRQRLTAASNRIPVSANPMSMKIPR